MFLFLIHSPRIYTVTYSRAVSLIMIYTSASPPKYGKVQIFIINIYQCLLNVPFSRMILYWAENRSAPSSFIPLLSWFLNSARQTMLLLNVFCNLDWLLKDTVFRQRVYELFWDGIFYYSEHPKKQQWKWMNKSILYLLHIMNILLIGRFAGLQKDMPEGVLKSDLWGQ